MSWLEFAGLEAPRRPFTNGQPSRMRVVRMAAAASSTSGADTAKSAR